MLALSLLEKLHVVHVHLDDVRRFGAPLLRLDHAVLSEIHTCDQTRYQQADRRDTYSDPARKPIHEVSLRRGQ
ncbi:hypothetical protein Adu01nite_08010 [Paractinoplanes durhamensis]|uniref:Uncharacterized protein n=1 Tax=Paractinoplanes durhamensis TaxID=113563 RepID=A0ABQ3YPI6_9ACTN|nr:hypothetical protein Adu01nite_08010 [Actinoplanes durhamensis]